MEEILKEYRYVLNLRGRSELTIENYFYTLDNLLNFNKEIYDITTKDIRRYLMKQKETNKLTTIKNKIATLKAFFNWAEKENFIKENPMNRIEKPNTNSNKRKHLTNYEIEFIRIQPKSLIDDTMFELFISSGLRVSEMVNLNWNNINFRERKITIKNGKGNKNRVTKFSTRASIFLEKYKEKRKDDNNWILQSNYKRRMSKESIERHINKLGNYDEIKIKVTPHTLRHSFATLLARKNVNLDIIQSLMGHSKIETTKRYINTSEENINYQFNTVFN